VLVAVAFATALVDIASVLLISTTVVTATTVRVVVTVLSAARTRRGAEAAMSKRRSCIVIYVFDKVVYEEFGRRKRYSES
jgi:hypothetical protein